MPPRPSRLEPIHARRFPPGEVILRQDVLPAFLHVVLHGLVKLSLVGFDGEEAVVGLVGTGEVFGEAVLLSHDGRGPPVLPAATALVQTLVGFVPWAWLGDGAFAFESPPVPAMLAALARRLQRAQESLAEAALLGTGARVARTLLRLAEEHGVGMAEGILIDVPMTQQDLARMIGVSRETVNRTLRRFAARGWVRAGNGPWVVLDVESLCAVGADIG